MTLEVMEFIRRFLLHILPTGYVKIRHYGILSNRSRQVKLRKSQEYLLATNKIKQKPKLSWEDLLLKLIGVDPRKCPVCGQRKMVIHETIHANRNSPSKSLILLNRTDDNLAINGKLVIESP